jgi:hypothetical protein
MLRSVSRWSLAPFGFALAACGSDGAHLTPIGQPVNHGDAAADAGHEAAEPVPDAACPVFVEAHAIEGNLHMATCSPLTFGTNPPSSGNHYAIWAAYRTYTQPFLPGFWVHSLEHGAVVIGYHCDGGCPDEVARAQAFIDALPNDCGAPARRVILLPNPDLDVRFAASAWGFTLRADCFDEPTFAAFVAAHYAQAPENICSDGIDPLTAGTGGVPLCP